MNLGGFANKRAILPQHLFSNKIRASSLSSAAMTLAATIQNGIAREVRLITPEGYLSIDPKRRFRLSKKSKNESINLAP